MYRGPIPAAAIKAVLISSAEGLFLRRTNNSREPRIVQSSDGTQGYSLINMTSVFLHISEGYGVTSAPPLTDGRAVRPDVLHKYPFSIGNRASVPGDCYIRLD